MNHEKSHHHIHPATHYAVLGSLLISNLTVLGLGMLLAGPFMGGSLGYFAYMGEANKIHSVKAATSKTSMTLQMQKKCSGVRSVSSGDAVVVGGIDPSLSVCLSAPTAPSAPSNLWTQAFSGTEVKLNWTDTSANESGFQIERGTGTPSSTPGFVWGEIGTQGSDIATYTDFTTMPSSNYTYRVRAFNGVGNSAYSNESVAGTPPTPPAAPSNLNAMGQSSHSVLLTWLDNSYNETGFSIDRATGTATSTLNWNQWSTQPAGTTSYTDPNGVPHTWYTYRVRAFNTAGSSNYSNTASASTY